jgi:hypothetical protein
MVRKLGVGIANEKNFMNARSQTTAKKQEDLEKDL